MAKLATAVFVRDPERHRTVRLLPGEEPEPRLAALVTNPACWEDGQLPTSDTADSGDDDAPGDTAKAAPAAKKTAATRKSPAPKPARGRDAADEGTSGN